MARARLTYMSDIEREFVHEQVVRVLAEVGIAYNSPQAIDLLADAGAPVDRAALTAKIPWELVQRSLAQVPRRILLAARDPRHDVVLDDDAFACITDGTGTFMLDDLTGEIREGTAADMRKVMNLFDALPEVDYVWPSISARDLDSATAGLEIEAIAIAACSKHLQDEVRVPEHVAPLLEIFEAVAGASLHDRPIFSTINCTIAPLQHEREMTEASMMLARAGVPILVLPMPQMGTTGPMTVLGTCIVNMAELLSAVVLFELAAPGCAVISGVGAAAAEMRSGLYLSGTPEVGLINAICIEMSHFYGLRVTGSAVSCDAKYINHQAGGEGMMTGLAAALAGAESMLAFSLLDGAQVVSLAKTMLDCDTVGAIRRFVREDPIDASTALFDDIAAIGIGGHYLGRRSTREFYRGGELWQPALWQRGPFESFAGTSLVRDAVDRVDEILATHVVPPLEEDVQRHIDGVIAGFARSART